MTYILQFVKSGNEQHKDEADRLERVEVPAGVSAIKFAAHRVEAHGGHSATIYYPDGRTRTIYQYEGRDVLKKNASTHIEHESITCDKYCK